MTTPCEVRVLGQLAVIFADGREPVTKFRTKKSAQLLAYLALHAGKAHAREFLIELLWPDTEPATGRNNLSMALSMLKRQLEPAGGKSLFDASHTTIQLSHEGIGVDAQRFGALVKRGLHTRLDAAERHTALTEALALWAPPLPGIYDDWAIEQQVRLEALAEQAREALECLPAPEPTAPVDPTPVVAPASSLPVAFSRFLGREQERVALAEQLQTARLVTLLGPGGVGKTRLALEVARASQEQKAFIRVAFASLAELPLPSLILPTLRRTLTDAPPAPDPLAQLVAVLNEIPGRVLIVLDNLEHLLPAENKDEGSDDEEKSRFGPARIVRQLLEACPNLVILATSRQPLGVEGEQQVAVEPLVGATGVELFVDRARAVRPDFTLHAGNQAEIEAICTLLDGLPLAIELAAAWVRVLTLPELRERLEKEVLWLEGRRRDLNPRQKSLEATLRWSWQLLSVEQKRLLSALSVFRGGWTLDAIESVHRSPDTLDLLYNLVDKSLVVVEQTSASTRFRLLETIRQFASERLDESGERDATHNRQAIFFLGLLSQLKDQLRGAGLKAALDSLEAEHDNFRAILRRPHDENRLTLVGRLARFWLIRGHFSEGREYLGKALDEAGSTALPLERALALLGLGSLERSQSDYVAARLHLEEALAIYRAKDEAPLMAGVLQHLGVIAQEQKELTQAQSYFEEALGIYREKGQTISIANQLNSLGVVFSDQSEFTKARAYLEESFDLNRAIGDDHQSSINLVNLGVLAAKQGDLKTAKIHFERSLTIQREFGDLRGIVGLLSNLSLIAFHQEDYAEGKRLNQEVLRLQSQIGNQRGVANSLWFHGGLCRVQGDWNQAVLFWSTATAFRERLGIAQLPKESADHPQELCDARTTLGKVAFEAAWEEGRQLSREDVVARVLR